LIIKPLGHNPPVRELGQIETIDPPPRPISLQGGLVPAIFISAGFHLLIVFLFWHCCQGGTRFDFDSAQIIDTRVNDPGMKVDVCLTLLDITSDPTSKSQKTAAPKAAQRANLMRAESKTNNESPRPDANIPINLAWAESSKPWSSPRGQQNTGPAIGQPWPREKITKFVQPSKGYLEGGSHGATGKAFSLSGLGKDLGPANGAVTFFQINARVKSVVYVIDRSVSMGPNGKLNRAKEELLNSLEKLPTDVRFQIIFFNRTFDMLSVEHSSDLLFATWENKQRVMAFLRTILPEGGTRPVPALKRALALKSDVIYFVSDQEDMDERDVREVTQLNRGVTSIHVFAIEDGKDGIQMSPLHKLAQNNRGECRVLHDTSWHGN
jgi:hypothetical protein